MKISRLFIKFFFIFWLAITLSFVTPLVFLESRDDSRPPPYQRVRFDLALQVLQSQGVAEALPLIRLMDADASPQVALLDADGKLLAGTAIQDGYGQPVTTAAGEQVQLVSTMSMERGGSRRLSFRLLPLFAGTLISLLFSGFIAWYLARPLLLLSSGLRAVGAGGLGTRVRPMLGKRRDELAELAEEFDRMALQLQKLVETRQSFMHDISHELRSPLTRLQFAIGLLRKNPAQGEILDRIERESSRLDLLIEELLTLARLESGITDFSKEKIDLIDLLVSIADDAQFEADAKGCKVELDTPESFVSQVSGELLYRAFENVIRNAIKFTNDNTRIRIVARVEPDSDGRDWLRIDITDQGDGVSPEMLAYIFDPFKRVSEPELKGFGLGLAIARRAVELHQGRIEAANLEQGLCITILLPRYVA